MLDQGMTEGEATSPNGATAGEESTAAALPLEQRVCRLEDAVAALQNTKELEERLVERVTRRTRRDNAKALKESAGAIMEAGKQILPSTLSILHSQAEHAEQHLAGAPGARRPWILFEAYAEARAMVRMFLDPHFRLSWPARLLPALLLFAILTSWLWLPGTSLLPSVMTVVDKLVDLILAFLAYKVLSREAQRYRDVMSNQLGR
jgi:hypothetical protein